MNSICAANAYQAGTASALTFPFEAHAVRALLRDGAPWFVAADVCAALDLWDALGELKDKASDGEERAMTAAYDQAKLTAASQTSEGGSETENACQAGTIWAMAA